MYKGRENDQRKNVKKRTMAGRRVSKCAAVAALSVTLALQPGFAMTAQAYTSTYDYGYPYWDDPYSSSYYYDTEGRKVTNVTRTYDDGTKYTAEYKYDSMGHLLYSNVKDSDGNRSTTNRSYSGEQLVAESSTGYDADYKREYTSSSQYSNGNQTYKLDSVKYSDGTSEREETWYLNDYAPLKTVEISRDGLTTQTDYTYNEHGKLLTSNKVVSDGSISQTEAQYDENGVAIYNKNYIYNATTQTHYTSEHRIEGEGASRSFYSVETETDSNGEVTKEESWGDASNTTKTVTTKPDGSQITENYSYDADGRETLYTKSDGSGIIEKRETTTTHTGRTTVYSDNKGNSSSYSRVYDTKNGRTIIEDSETSADGSSRYTKQIYSDNYSTESYISRYKGADGRESSTEKTYSSDGSSIIREKDTDGTVRETKRNADGYETSVIETRPDGTKSETSWERREDGLKASETKRYSDKGEDKIVYEYNDKREVIRETETRRNGISAITQYQYNDAGYMNLMSTTFSNGYQFTGTQEVTDKNTTNIVYTYSAGDISQHILIDDNGETYDTYVKIVYRDGRTEEYTSNYWDDDWDDKVGAIEAYYYSYLQMAWDNQPIPESSIEVAAGAEETDVSNTVDVAATGVPEAESTDNADEAADDRPAETDEPKFTGPASEIEYRMNQQ